MYMSRRAVQKKIDDAKNRLVMDYKTLTADLPDIKMTKFEHLPESITEAFSLINLLIENRITVRR